MTPNSSKTDNYVNVRVRLQRVSDAKFFSAWVRSMNETEVVLDISITEWFSPGTKFFLTVSGIDSTALFQADVAQQASGILRMVITSEIKFAKPVEEARKSTVGLLGVIHLGDIGIEMMIQDVSAKGLGGIIEGSIPRGRILDIDVESPFGTIIGKAEVRYCRRESPDSLRHRIGLRIVSMGRVETTRWLRLSDENAA